MRPDGRGVADWMEDGGMKLLETLGGTSRVTNLVSNVVYMVHNTPSAVVTNMHADGDEHKAIFQQVWSFVCEVLTYTTNTQHIDE